MLLGIPKQTWYEHTPLPNEERYKDKLRKERNVSKIVINQHRFIKDFCHSEEASHLDSNSRRIVVALNKNGEEEKYVGRVWEFPTVREEHTVYRIYDGVTYMLHAGQFTIPRLSTFYKYRCPCVIHQYMQSCVDKRLSAEVHYMRGVSKYLRYNKELRDKLNDNGTYPFMRYLHGTVVHMVDSTMCTTVEHSELVWGSGSSRNITRLNEWKCAKGTCDEC